MNNVDNIENREVVVTLNNGIQIHIVACYESWQQYGGTIDEMKITAPIAEQYNGWLHGEENEWY